VKFGLSIHWAGRLVRRGAIPLPMKLKRFATVVDFLSKKQGRRNVRRKN
jgi:hypothetical protein